eukprot:PhF_6_TR8625/c0_g1_i2/m.13461
MNPPRPPQQLMRSSPPGVGMFPSLGRGCGSATYEHQILQQTVAAVMSGTPSGTVTPVSPATSRCSTEDGMFLPIIATSTTAAPPAASQVAPTLPPPPPPPVIVSSTGTNNSLISICSSDTESDGGHEIRRLIRPNPPLQSRKESNASKTFTKRAQRNAASLSFKRNLLLREASNPFTSTILPPSSVLAVTLPASGVVDVLCATTAKTIMGLSGSCTNSLGVGSGGAGTTGTPQPVIHFCPINQKLPPMQTPVL